ncbi:hypothetical protein [Bradyrhizobium frederickii]|uniref:hypothetical protein n=1 Tax=Bradyrhizobium frederickii TaxID=2560054 RepID=UPI001431897B|nr:hypothetical protein [Bradyrhizobium frederickii]
MFAKPQQANLVERCCHLAEGPEGDMRDIILSTAARFFAVEHTCGVGQPLPLDEPWLEMEIDIERENEVLGFERAHN